MKKILSAISAAALLIASSSLCGCSSKNSDELVMATNAEFPPFEYIDEQGEYAGIDVEIAEAIAEKLGKKRSKGC